MVALSLTGLLGFGALAVDYGMLVSDKNRLQRACDAAALAGASQLRLLNNATDLANARQMAVITARENGVTVNPNAVSFNLTSTEVTVPANVTRQHYFARVLGISTGNVGASATAGVKAVNSMTTNNVVPIGITWSTYNAYSQSRVPHNLDLTRPTQQLVGIDDFVLYDLRQQDSKSPEHMMRQLIGDVQDMAKLGDAETTIVPGSLEAKFKEGAATLFQRASQAPWHDASASPMINAVGNRFNEILAGTAPRDNPRLMHLIIFPNTTNTGNGTYNTEVQGFAPVYLEAVRDVTINGVTTVQIQVRFLPPTYRSDTQYESGPGILPDGTAVPISGARVISLLR
jgi:Flp pilus assembly protein TadG